MKNFFLTTLNNIAAALLIVLFGMLAIKTSSMLLAILLWFIVYIILDLHVYLSNNLKIILTYFINYDYINYCRLPE